MDKSTEEKIKVIAERLFYGTRFFQEPERVILLTKQK